MNARFAVRFFALALLAGALFSCSREGDVTVVNDCSTPFTGYLKDRPITLAPGASLSETVYIGKKAIVIGPDEIGVPFGGSTFTRRPFEGSIAVKTDETTTYRVSSDAGAIYFMNAHAQSVTGLLLKGCSESAYGDNLLVRGAVLNFGRTFLIRLDEGCWDLLVRYGTTNLSDTVSNDTIVVGRVDTILWQPGP